MIDTNRDKLITPHAMKLFRDFYMLPEEKSPQEAFMRASKAYCEGDGKLAERIYEYVSKQWFMFSSPILSNAPKEGESFKALPISCFLSYVPDTVQGLVEHHAETAWLSVKGGGVGGHWSDVRAVTDKSVGVIPMLKVVDSQMQAYKQGKTRKGNYAGYLDINHPEIVEFMNFKLPTGGDANRKCFNIFNAVNVTDAFMDAVVKGEEWNLLCPRTRDITDTVEARKLWERLLDARFRTGSPYLNFIDTARKSMPEYQKEKGLDIHGSNLCLTGDTLVNVFLDGKESTIRLDTLVESEQDYKVLSMNTATGRTTYEEVTAKSLMSKNAELYEITDEDGNTIKCTGDHKVWTENRGYVMAKELVETDELLSLKYSVYKITNKVTGNTYIGYTRHKPEHRLKVHFNNASNMKDTHLYRSMRKHGFDNFQIDTITTAYSKETALNKEKELISSLGHYNETEGGVGGWCVPFHKFKEWTETISFKNSGEGNGKWSGWSDEAILDHACTYFKNKSIEDTGKSVTSFMSWSSIALGMPRHYSSCRFNNYSGTGRERFKKAYNDRVNKND